MNAVSEKALVCLITGANGGLGSALAREFAWHDYDLVLVVRHAHSVETLCQELEQEFACKIDVISADLARENAAQHIYRELARRKIQVDVLVNNAGFGNYGFFHENSFENQSDLLRVNVLAPVELTRLLVPSMIQRGQGKILNIASTAAFQPGPLMATYYASKAFLLHFSEAIGNELEPFGVQVSALCPGPTATNFQSRSRMGNARVIQKGRLLDPAVVAKTAYNGLEKKKRVIVPGLDNQAKSLVPRLLPRAWTVAGMRYLQDQKKTKKKART